VNRDTKIYAVINAMDRYTLELVLAAYDVTISVMDTELSLRTLVLRGYQEGTIKAIDLLAASDR
jgi:hypothetical protein